MKAELLLVGSELVSGQKLDTNGQWLSHRLGDLGLPVRFFTLLGDDLEDNVAAFQTAIARAEVVLTSGGLGPTQDDLTREALARVAGVELVEDAGSLQAIAEMFARRNRTMTDRNRVQAMLPKGAEPLPNRVGTAPGIWLPVGRAVVACLPGVPSELKIMFEEQVVPRLRRLGYSNRVIVHRTVNMFGLGESDIEAQALDLTARGRVPEVGITASNATISFRVSAEGADEAEALRLIEPTLETIRERFGELIVGEGLEGVADGLVRELKRSGRTLATAESCTGGLIAHRITEVPGVSPHYPGGVVSYSENAKLILIDVPPDLIASKGVVSAEVAEAMAVGVRRRLETDLGLSITGIAGPEGGTPETPVGCVYIGLADEKEVRSRRIEIGPEQPRNVIQGRSAKHAMNMVRLHLLRERLGPKGEEEKS